MIEKTTSASFILENELSQKEEVEVKALSGGDRIKFQEIYIIILHLNV